MMTIKTPRPAIYTLQDVLVAIDSKYFDCCDDCQTTDTEDAAYRIATWLFDKGFMERRYDNNAPLRKHLKKVCPPSLYLLALEYFIDGKYDT